MARRPTLADVARLAGVSVATVDRVLNGREAVREETARRVADAAARAGYHAAALIDRRLAVDLPELRLGVVLHKERQAFYQNFSAELETAVRTAPGLRGRLRLDFAPSQGPGDFSSRILAMRDRVDVVAATAVTHHEVSDAVSALKEAGVPCYALLNDFAQGIRQGYIGLNNLKVGRIAASMIATSVHRPGKLAVFVGGYRWHGHELRETGFRSYFREYAPQFQILDTLVNLETRQLTYEATLDLLNRHPDLRGIYVAGGGMEGAIAALREVRQPGEVVLVVNEITPESRAGLLDRYIGLAICTPLAQLCRELVAQARSTAARGASDVPGQIFLRPELLLPECL
jgi:LacI family transcriptional regulator, galactose operon repressor